MAFTKIKSGLVLDSDSFKITLSQKGRPFSTGDFISAFNFIHQFGIGQVVGRLAAETNKENCEVLFIKFHEKELSKIHDLYENVQHTDKDDEASLLELIYRKLKDKEEVTILIS